jgi:L-threonylcarbamoyladenylate synthase
VQTATLRADDPQAMSHAGALLRRGEVVAFPTDTVYGVGAHALQTEAVARLYAVKGRPFSKAIPVLIARVEDVQRVARAIPPAAWPLAERFWPGGLTIVLPRSEQLPDLLTAGGDTVAIRYPDHPVPLALMRALGAPLAATSANLSGQPAPTTAQEVGQQLSGRLPLILDGGQCAVGVPSTLIDLSVSPPRLLRAGAIPLEALRRILPELTE